MNNKLIGNMGQWLAVVLTLSGICVELHYEAHLGFVFITIGALALALATKVKYYKG